MKKLFLLFIFLSAFQAKSQLFTVYDSKHMFLFYRLFVDVTKDSVIVEIFSCSYPNFTDSVYTEVLKPDNKISDIKFAGKNTELMIDRGDYYLLFKKNCFQDYETLKYFNKKKIKLNLAQTNERNSFLKSAYKNKISERLRNLGDSLGVNYSRNFLYIDDNKDTLTIYEHRTAIDLIADTIERFILKNKMPEAEMYYCVSDSIEKADTALIFRMLAEAKYNFYYSDYFLRKLAAAKPEVLIAYIDKNPPNKKTVLKAIKNHRYLKEIVANVKKTEIDTKAKKLIKRQKTKQNIEDVAIATGIITLLVGEIVLIVLLAKAIF